MNTRVRNYLIDISNKKGIVRYQDLCDACGLNLDMRNEPADRLEIGNILDEISTFEYENKRPLLSAVVIKRDGEEGDGFYKLCERLGRTSDWRKLKQDEVFTTEEIKECHKFWSNPVNYQKHK